MMRQTLIFALAMLALIALASAARQPKAWNDGYDFTALELRSGKQLSRESLTDGKALVLFTWAPDCPHCRAQMPYVEALIKKLDAADVAFVSASLDGSESDTLDYLDGKELDWPVLYGADGGFADDYYDEGWPTTYVFASGGDYVGMCDTQGPSYIKEALALVGDAS